MFSDHNRGPVVLSHHHPLGRGTTGGSQQPDLVKVSSLGPRAAPQQAEIARLENVVDKRNSQIKETRAVAAHNAKGFDAMSALVGYLANDVSI